VRDNGEMQFKEEVPDLDSKKFPQRVTIAVSDEAHETLEKMRAAGKNVPKFIREKLNQAILEAVVEKKTG
jgi:hypothetical protein